MLNGVTFVLFGAILLGPALTELSWELALYAALSLTVVRMLPVAIAMLGSHARAPTLGFLGWFGPRGLASIVFAVIVIEESNLPHEHLIVLAIYLTVGLSVFAHGAQRRPARQPLRPLVRATPPRHGTADGERPGRSHASARPQGGRDMTGEPRSPRAILRSCSSTDSRLEPSSRAGWSARSSGSKRRALQVLDVLFVMRDADTAELVAIERASADRALGRDSSTPPSGRGALGDASGS